MFPVLLEVACTSKTDIMGLGPENIFDTLENDASAAFINPTAILRSVPVVKV